MAPWCSPWSAATVAQMLDLGTFVRMIAIHGPLAEGNPLVAHLLDELGVPFLAVAKIAVLSLVIAIVAVLWGGTTSAGTRVWRPRSSASRSWPAGSCGLTNATVLL